MAAAPTVGIVGLAELRRDLIRLDTAEVPKALVAAGLAVANPLAGQIRSALPHGPTGRLAGSVRAGRTRTGATVRVGSKAVAYAGWIEFGGSLGERQHYATRPFLAGGRYIFPTAKAAGARAVEEYARQIEQIIDRFAWSNPTGGGS